MKMDIRSQQKKYSIAFIICFLVVGLYQQSWDQTLWREEHFSLVRVEMPSLVQRSLTAYSQNKPNTSILMYQGKQIPFDLERGSKYRWER